MIILKKMKWSNWFSYGDNNEINFDKEIVTQILGTNGSGKSSISLILEEILYGKNSKGAKKQDISNRYTDKAEITGEVYLVVDGVNYTIKLNRKNVIKLTLLKEGVDISEHTSTRTYKLIEKIIGLNFKTFSQLIYQSSTDSLQFLIATDAQRKAFLVSLFNLDKYTTIYTSIKEGYNESSKTVSKLEGTCDTLLKWIEKHSNTDLNIKNLYENIPAPEEEIKEIVILKNKLLTIDKENEKRIANNQYKLMLDKIDTNALYSNVQKPINTQKIIKDKNILDNDIIREHAALKELNKLNEAYCSKCKQPIDLTLKNKMIEEHSNTINEKQIKVADLIVQLDLLKSQSIKYKAHITAIEEVEKFSSLINKDLSTELLDEEDLKLKLNLLITKVEVIKKNINKVIEANNIITEHNSKVNVIVEQLVDYNKQLDAKSIELAEAEDLLVSLDILRKSFGTTGLISYKIEYLVKDLEREINEYLQDFSDGRFLFSFILKGDKLNIEISNNGKGVDIASLSSGELARVNVSTLLAIRKMMANISKAKINLLFLDELMGVLDNFGKEKLIEVLLNEKDLNTFIVSHGWSHPLLDKLEVVKENNISRIDHGR